MDKEAQRIAIAEACGAKWFVVDLGIDRLSGQITKGYVYLSFDDMGFSRGIPDYLDDLDAIHKVENALITTELEFQYQCHLKEISGQPYGYRAKADQRAAAVLRTIGKWIE